MAQALSWFVLVLAIFLGAMLFTIVSRKTEGFAELDAMDERIDLPDSNAEPVLDDLSPADGSFADDMGGDDMGEAGDDDGDAQAGDEVAPFLGEEFTPYA